VDEVCLRYINVIILNFNYFVLFCLVPQGRLKYEMDGSQKIKRIVFDKSGKLIFYSIN